MSSSKCGTLSSRALIDLFDRIVFKKLFYQHELTFIYKYMKDNNGSSCRPMSSILSGDFLIRFLSMMPEMITALVSGSGNLYTSKATVAASTTKKDNTLSSLDALGGTSSHHLIKDFSMHDVIEICDYISDLMTFIDINFHNIFQTASPGPHNKQESVVIPVPKLCTARV